MFPPEIIDHVLSFLQWDHETLKVCARAHPSISKLVERHFYRHLIIQDVEKPYRSGAYCSLDLLKVIIDNPDIANHVRSLRIYSVGRFCRESEPLQTILSTITRLQTFSLSSTVGIVWDNLCESFRTAFTNFLRLPTLTEVELSDVDGFPLSALDHSSSLKRLSLSGYFSYLPPSVPHVSPPLDFLDLSSCPPRSMDIIAYWLGSRGLHSLQLTHSIKVSSRPLEVCSNTLTALHVYVPLYYSDTPTIPLPISHLPHLAQLTVQTLIYFGLTGKIHTCLPAIMHFLNTLPSPPIKLVHLIIKVDINFRNNLNAISNTDWSPLVSFPYFGVIPSVELQVRAKETPIRLTELLNKLKQHPQLMKLDGHRSFRMSVGPWQDSN